MKIQFVAAFAVIGTILSNRMAVRESPRRSFLDRHRASCIKIAALAALLQGCSVFQGIPVVLKPDGAVTSLRDASKPPGSGKGAIGLFELSYKVAEDDQRRVSRAEVLAPTTATDPASIHARQMALDGVNLVGVYCTDFFRTRGDHQTVLNVARDVTAASGSLAASVLAFTSPANALASGIISLATATTSNTLDIYTKNFLFGADNIETVRTMTLAALAAHKTAALPDNDTSVWDFGGASTTIADHQDICTPASIRSLVLSSISKSKFVPVAPAAAAPPPATTAEATAAARRAAVDRHIAIGVKEGQ